MNASFSTTSPALAGIQRGLRGLHNAAHDIAQRGVKPVTPGDLAEPLVRSFEYGQTVEAAASALRRSNEALGSLIDVLV